MAWVTPSNVATGDVLTAAEWNQDVVENTSVLFNRDGLVPVYKTTFSAASSVTSSANVFSSTYTNYRVLVVITAASASASLLIRLRAGSSDFSTGTHYRARWVVNATGGTGALGSQTDTGLIIGQHFAATSTYGFAADLYGPNTANAYKSVTAHASSWDGGGSAAGTYLEVSSGRVATATQYDAFTLLPSSGNITGEVQVYGYAKP